MKDEFLGLEWTEVEKDVSELSEYPKNARILTKRGLKQLEESMETFGLAQPLNINTDNMIIGGHGRLKILQKHGVKKVKCWLPERDLSDKEFEQLNIRLNKNIAGEFDMERLANEFDMPDLLAWGFDEKELLGSGVGGVGGDEYNEPEQEFNEELLLEHNYVLLYFDNALDWQVAQEKLKLKEINPKHARKGQATGIGRVIRGKEILDRITDV